MEWSRLHSITLHQLRTFCTVCRLMSYTRAAEDLGCQQPTVSTLIGELERATRLTLLEQHGKRVMLTSEGRELLAHAQRVVAAVDAAWETIAAQRGMTPGISPPLSIAADTTIGTYVLPHLLGIFRHRHPAVMLSLRVENREAVRASLLAGEVDLAIAGRPPDIEGLTSEPFLAHQLVVIAAPGHPLVGQSRISLERLADEAFFLREPGSGTRAAVEELFEMSDTQLKASMVLGHIEAIKRAVAVGLGVSVLSAMAIKREVRSGTLAMLNVEHFPIQRRWFIAYLAQKPLTSIATKFIEFLYEQKGVREMNP